MAKLTAAQKRVLSATEAARVTAALKPHNDAVVLVKDIRAVRALRQKQRDALGKQVRAIKKGEKAPVRQEGLSQRTKEKEAIFDQVLGGLEERLKKVHAVVASESPAKKKPSTKAASASAQAHGLLEESLAVIAADAKSLRASNTLDGQLVDPLGGQVTKELASLEGLAHRIEAFLGRSQR